MRINKPVKNYEAVKNIGIFCWSVIGLLILVALFFYIIYLIKIAIIPLIIAVGIAYLLTPLVVLLQKKMKKVFAVTITYVIFTGIIFTIFFFMIPTVVDQLRIFIEKLPIYIINLTNIINDFLEKSIIVTNIENMIGKEIIPKDTNAITQYVVNSLKNINFFQSVTSFTRSIINILITFIIGPLLGIYILKDSHKLREVFIKVIPVRFKSHASTIIDKVNSVGGKYIRGQILVAIIVGTLCTVVLLILRVDFPILLGFMAGIFNLIPFLGPIIGAIPAALTALFISPLKAVLVILLFIAVQQIDNYLISPNVMKYQIGIHPGILIFSLIAGGAIFGVIGLLLAVPTVAVFQEIFKYYLIDRKTRHPDRLP
ncbi:MAG: AI-2E family transporter [Actinobacteria bacterium]|nr:AI-2E family transporter [Actinomycetota bacterium]